MRVPAHRYVDPLDAIWISALGKVGYRLARSGEVYASMDGAGTLVLGTDETLDPDDCVAQMVFHELCHSLVQGHEGLEAIDWGLSNLTDEDVWREHATLRLQALLSAEHGLRDVLAPTTDFRAYYDALGDDPLRGEAGDPSVALAKEALARVDSAPWGPHVRDGLRATARVIAAVREVGADAAVPGGALPSLLSLLGGRGGIGDRADSSRRLSPPSGRERT